MLLVEVMAFVHDTEVLMLLYQYYIWIIFFSFTVLSQL